MRNAEAGPHGLRSTKEDDASRFQDPLYCLEACKTQAAATRLEFVNCADA